MPDTELVVRRIRPCELDELLELYKHLHAQDSPLPPRDRLDSLWRQIQANPLLHYIGAELDGRLVGSCTLAIIPNLTRGARPYGVIENVVTHADHRRRGIGTAVLQRALQIAWSQDCYKVMLLTGSKQASTLRFYEKAGFRRDVKTGFIAAP